jgi:hypothetical protein
MKNVNSDMFESTKTKEKYMPSIPAPAEDLALYMVPMKETS